MNTKRHILEIALNLFSKRGYSAVSIRDICGQVGIKESTIYYHFKNKQAIFDTLCDDFLAVSYAIPEKFAVEMAKSTSVTRDTFIKVCKFSFNNYLLDEKINKFLRMLIFEQNVNPKAAALYHKVLFDDALTEQKKIFGWLIGVGFLKKANIDSMVMDYYAPTVFLFHRYLVAGEINETVRKEANKHLDRHIDNFIEKYGKCKQRKGVQ